MYTLFTDWHVSQLILSTMNLTYFEWLPSFSTHLLYTRKLHANYARLLQGYCYTLHLV